MILTGRDLAEIGQLLHGPRWRARLASRLKKSERTIRRYEKEGSRIPRKVRLQLADAVRAQRVALEKWEKQIV